MNIEKRIAREIRTIINSETSVSAFNRAVTELRHLVWAQDNPRTYESVKEFFESLDCSRVEKIKLAREHFGLSLATSHWLYNQLQD